MPDITFAGAATRLAAGDIARAALSLSCDAAAVRAVCRVEASGGGFLPDGRPKILFEAQVFHRLTGGQFDADHPGVSSPTWDRSLYGAPGTHQYDRLVEAMALDQEAALQAASWGLFQILGENHRACGFASAQDFVSAMVSGEGAQLDAFAALVRSNARLLQAIQAQDWPTFARYYNGPGQVDSYAGKLAAAYEAGTAEA